MISENKEYQNIDTVCGACGQKFENFGQLKSHARKDHKQTIQEYYQKNLPRYDLLTGKLIEFKTIEQYFRDNFNDRLNMRGWLLNQSPENAKKYCLDMLKKRIVNKNIKYSPCELETKNTILPPVSFFQHKFGNWYEECEKLGLINKFVDYDPMEKRTYKCLGHNIVIDTREQKPLILKNCNTVKKTMKYGDYCLESFEGRTVIERKSLKDFVATLCSDNLLRFKRELDKCKQSNAYMVILIEEPCLRALNFDKIDRVNKYVKVTPDYIFRHLRDLMQEYQNIQFLFTNGRVEAGRVVKKILFSGGDFNKYDLQLIYDKKYL